MVVVEILALSGEVGINLAALLTQAWGSNGSLAAVAGLMSWGYILALARKLTKLFVSEAMEPYGKSVRVSVVVYGSVIPLCHHPPTIKTSSDFYDCRFCPSYATWPHLPYYKEGKQGSHLGV